jgi:phospholipid/cholesterol/gamma-HCH transport system ATP-binding protein
MIEIENISKKFGSTEVLKSISGEFYQGKTNLIIGASGTGKSVLLKCIVGLIQPDEGSVFYDKRDFTNANKELKTDIRREIGMLFQGVALFDSMTVGENVRFPLDILTTMPEDEKEERVNKCLEQVDLPNVAHQMPSELSGGMKKRVGIARAIVNDARYLFCDEPNSGLDPQTSIVIDELIQNITEELNTTTIVVTHDMNSVLGIGQHVLFLHKGEKVWEGNQDNIMKTDVPELKSFFFANKLVKQVTGNDS